MIYIITFLITIALITILICIMMLYRNNIVCKIRIEASDIICKRNMKLIECGEEASWKEYDEAPDYDYMVFNMLECWSFDCFFPKVSKLNK